MSRHFHMLQKVRLERELFGEPMSGGEVAETPPAPDTPEEETVLPEKKEPATASAVSFAEVEPDEEPPVESGRPWRESLGELLSAPLPDDCRRVTLCPLSSMTTAAEAATAVALWIANSGGGSTLIVEANYARPHLARLFHASRLGLGEATLASEPAARFVQDTHRDDIKILPAGRRPPRAQRQAWARGLSGLLDAVAPKFNQIVIEAPSPVEPEFAFLDLGRSDQLLLGVLQPSLSRHGAARWMRRELAKAKAPLAGVLLAPQYSMGDVIRMERLARQFERPPAARAAVGAAAG